MEARTVWTESSGMREKEREGERERRAGAREQDAERQNLLDAAVHLSRAAATAPTHSPPLHTQSRHALPLTAMSNRLITYLLRSSQQCIKTRCFVQLLPSSCTLGTNASCLTAWLFIS
ncbi:hypothetical protein QQF64_004781 [Cirrhinus molitorella]|uniref:Uncharacterized protein n=1 Tax=Cirrhinus molitorella TaxID=172907 RepID=A0ABR3MH75_9TELE